MTRTTEHLEAFTSKSGCQLITSGHALRQKGPHVGPCTSHSATPQGLHATSTMTALTAEPSGCLHPFLLTSHGWGPTSTPLELSILVWWKTPESTEVSSLGVRSSPPGSSLFQMLPEMQRSYPIGPGWTHCHLACGTPRANGLVPALRPTIIFPGGLRGGRSPCKKGS